MSETPRFLALDLDNVVFDTHAYLKRRWPKRGPAMDETKWDLGSPATMQAVLHDFHVDGVATVRLYRGADKVIKRLIAARVDLAFVSARPRSCWDATADSLARYGIGVRGRERDADLLLLDEADKVGYLLAELGDRRITDCLLLDDRFSTVARATELGLPAMLYDQPWNRQFGPVPIPRVTGWIGQDSLAEALGLQ